MSRPARLALAVLTVGFVALGLVQAARDAPTVDEGPDLVASLVTVSNRDLRLNPEHGALFHAAAGVLPVLLSDPLLPETDAYRDGAWFDYTDQVVSANDAAGRLDEVLFWFRVAPLLAGAATAWVLFALGRRLGGDLGGLLAGGLWLSTPYVLGLSHLGSLDIAFSLAAAGLVLVLVRDREGPSAGRLVAVATVLGAALAVRHTAVVLVPVAIALVVLHRRADRREALKALAVAAVLPVVVVWGETWEGSRPWFFPASTAVKLPLTASLAVLGGIALLVARRWDDALVVPLASTAVVLGGFLLVQPLNLGLRLAVPVIALAMVPAAMLAGLLRSRASHLAAGAMAALQVAAVVVAHPTSLAWTPPPFSDGYRWVSDSSIDFGQALHAVREAHAADPFVAVSVVTPRGLSRPVGVGPVAGADAEALLGRIAVGATPLLVTEADELSWLRAYCPVEVLDGAVLVYEFDSPPDQAPASGRPAPPCEGAASSRR